MAHNLRKSKEDSDELRKAESGRKDDGEGKHLKLVLSDDECVADRDIASCMNTFDKEKEALNLGGALELEGNTFSQIFSPSSVSLYFKSISKYSLLNEDEEKKIACMIKDYENECTGLVTEWVTLVHRKYMALFTLKQAKDILDQLEKDHSFVALLDEISRLLKERKKIEHLLKQAKSQSAVNLPQGNFTVCHCLGQNRHRILQLYVAELQPLIEVTIGMEQFEVVSQNSGNFMFGHNARIHLPPLPETPFYCQPPLVMLFPWIMINSGIYILSSEGDISNVMEITGLQAVPFIVLGGLIACIGAFFFISLFPLLGLAPQDKKTLYVIPASLFLWGSLTKLVGHLIVPGSPFAVRYHLEGEILSVNMFIYMTIVGLLLAIIYKAISERTAEGNRN